MRKFVLCLACAFCMMLSVQATEGYMWTHWNSDPVNVYMTTLPNGLKIYISPNKEKPRITAHIAVNTGHKNDPAETTGLAHYLEHLMFKGTTHFGTSNYEAERPLLDQITDLYEEYRTLTDPEERKAKYHQIDSISQLAAQYNIPNEYDKLMAAIGGEGSNAYTWYDITCYTEDIPSNEFENWAKIQSDRFMNMVVRGFHTELETVYEEKNMSLVNDGEKAFDALMYKLFPSHSYGTQTTIGTQDHLKNPSIVNILNYYNKYYKPNNIAICLVGDFESLDPDNANLERNEAYTLRVLDKAVDIIEKYFGEWRPGADIAHRQFANQPVYTAPQDTTVVGMEQENVMLGWRMKGAADMQNDTLRLLDQILYNGKAGLFDLDLNQKMVVMGSGAQTMALKEYGVFVVEGVPNEGQTLDEVKSRLLAEVRKLKDGDFDEGLLKAVVNNMKLRFNRSIEENRGRVSLLVDAFINGQKWDDVFTQIDRISRLTKADIVKFANEHLTDGYVCVYKKQGEDTSIKKIDKPAITPIPSNRDMHSRFLDDIVASHVDPIQPAFVDFSRDLTFTETKTKLPVIYKQNTDNEIFNLEFRYDFGNEADNRYDVAADYLALLGTDRMSNEDIQKRFYALACNYNIRVGEDQIIVSLSGLNENMGEALALYENVVANAKSDKEVYDMYVDQILKSRDDEKKQQKACFKALWDYALYGSYNPTTNQMTSEQLKSTDPQTLLSLLKALNGYNHTVVYYGPSAQTDLLALITKQHKTAKRLSAVPENKHYTYVQTPTNEVLIAPYDAKNIYLSKLNNEGRQWSPDDEAVKVVFNEYFGGGMNTIVFQELREARGLAYSASAYYITPNKKDDPEYCREYIITQNDKLMDCINVFAEITDQLPQSEAAFLLAKQSVEKSLQCERTTKMRLVNSYFACKKLGIDRPLSSAVYTALPSLQLNDIANFERSTMAHKPWHYVILGNEKELDMQSLSKIGTIRRVTLDDIFCK